MLWKVLCAVVLIHTGLWLWLACCWETRLPQEGNCGRVYWWWHEAPRTSTPIHNMTVGRETLIIFSAVHVGPYGWTLCSSCTTCWVIWENTVYFTSGKAGEDGWWKFWLSSVRIRGAAGLFWLGRSWQSRSCHQSHTHLKLVICTQTFTFMMYGIWPYPKQILSI